MVVVLAVQAMDVQSDGSALGEALQAVGDHLARQVANLLAAQAEVDDRVGPVGQVDDGARQRLVERAVGAAEARQARRAAQRLLERLAQRDARVFGRVVVVDCGNNPRSQPFMLVLFHVSLSLWVILESSRRCIVWRKLFPGKTTGMTYCAGLRGSAASATSRRAWPGREACGRGSQCPSRCRCAGSWMPGRRGPEHRRRWPRRQRAREHRRRG